MGCCVFLRWPSSNRYRALTAAEDVDSLPQVRAAAEPAVRRVVVGRERREFLVDPFVLEREPFRVLMEEMVTKDDGSAIFVHVDAIFFEHMLWSFYNDDYYSSPLFLLNFREIIEFYSQDS